MNSRVLAAIAAALLAFIGIGAVVMYAAGAEKRANDNATLYTVYRATDSINANASSDEVKALVEEVRLPSAAVPKGAIKSLQEINGLKTTVPLVGGEVLISARFDKSGSSAAKGSTVPEGKQEISIMLATDAAGGASAGNKVGVIFTGETKDGDQLAKMFAQQVLVTRVEASGENVIVSLATDGKLATEVAAAVRFGQVRLSLQNEDSTRDGGNRLDVRNLAR